MKKRIYTLNRVALTTCLLLIGVLLAACIVDDRNVRSDVSTDEGLTSTPDQGVAIETTECLYLSKTYAEMILGVPVTIVDEEVRYDPISCGYHEDKPATEILEDEQLRFVGYQWMYGTVAVEGLDAMLEQIKLANPNLDTARFTIAKSLLESKKLDEVIDLLPLLTENNPTFRILPLEYIGEAAVWMRESNDEDALAMVVVANQQDEIFLLAATPPHVEKRYPQLFEGMRAAVQALFGEPLILDIEGDPPTENRPAGAWVEDCGYFSRFDAAAILQEHVYATSIGNLIFGPSSLSAADQKGLCGFISEVEAAPFAEDDATPRLLTDLASDHILAAGVLDGATSGDLRALIESAFAGDENFVDTYLPQIVAHQIVGDSAPIIPLLHEASEESQLLRAESVEGLAEEGIWLWRSFDGGHFSLLLLRNGDEFATIVALLGDHVDDLTVLDYSLSIARRLLEERPLVESSNPQSEQMESPSCDLLSAEEAAAILGEEVHATPVNYDEKGCGYVAASEPSPDSFVEHGVFVNRLMGEEMVKTLQGIKDSLGEGLDDYDDEAELIFDAALLSGKTEWAIRMLDNLAKGSRNWRVEELKEVNAYSSFLWGQLGDQRIAALITLDEQGNLVTIVAQIPSERRRRDVREPIIAIAAKVAKQ